MNSKAMNTENEIQLLKVAIKHAIDCQNFQEALRLVEIAQRLQAEKQ